MNIPTPVDFIQYFLYLSNPAFDFSTMIHESLPYAYVALIGKWYLIFLESSIMTFIIL